MGWFGSSTGLERQKEIYTEQMEKVQEQLEAIEGVDSAETNLRREELQREYGDLELNLEQVRSQMELQGMDNGTDLFHD